MIFFTFYFVDFPFPLLSILSFLHLSFFLIYKKLLINLFLHTCSFPFSSFITYLLFIFLSFSILFFYLPFFLTFQFLSFLKMIYIFSYFPFLAFLHLFFLYPLSCFFQFFQIFTPFKFFYILFFWLFASKNLSFFFARVFFFKLFFILKLY